MVLGLLYQWSDSIKAATYVYAVKCFGHQPDNVFPLFGHVEGVGWEKRQLVCKICWVTFKIWIGSKITSVFMLGWSGFNTILQFSVKEPKTLLAVGWLTAIASQQSTNHIHMDEHLSRMVQTELMLIQCRGLALRTTKVLLSPMIPWIISRISQESWK